MSVPATINFNDPSVTVKVTLKQNKDLSSAVDDVLKVQGVSWIVRNALKLAPITLKLQFFTDTEGLVRLDIEQLLPAGAKSEEPRILDNEERARVSSVFGPVVARSEFTTADEAAKISPFLAQGWDADAKLIFAYAKGDLSQPKSYEWESFQTFGFTDIEVDEGKFERKYVVRLYFTSKSLKEPLTKRLVYDFVELGV
ncbi:hypothetical protein BZA70DRAFT_60891 [Myxozyma melibiosi]|uniref:Uncharacterized protein n=1 Tax=Myxozyma melibiosi TaxID=54550 RepID=A0ABR1F416_9ASCO